MNDADLSLVYRVRPPQTASAAGRQPPLLLLLHGIGSNEDDLYGLAPYLDERFLIVSARAPLALGPMAYGWFNIEYTPQGLVGDLAQAEQSYQLLLRFIDELAEKYQTGGAGIYLAGFSQGAMMSLSIALTHPQKVAGVVALSGRLPTSAIAHLAAPEDLAGLPIFLAHGTDDFVIPIDFAREAREFLAELPIELTYREYPMAHQVSMESLQDIRAWLSERLGQKAV
ncbi:MAG: alpha/beta hydrolase [Pyrinomonadaceae bacterium]|nr:alpha/beta fold hydrolase [Pyrinomonadaceae bacterium]MDQ3586205.1 alpha/beta fold hydrolase [Acidobacteriota bacterium]